MVTSQVSLHRGGLRASERYSLHRSMLVFYCTCTFRQCGVHWSAVCRAQWELTFRFTRHSTKCSPCQRSASTPVTHRDSSILSQLLARALHETAARHASGSTPAIPALPARPRIGDAGVHGTAAADNQARLYPRTLALRRPGRRKQGS